MDKKEINNILDRALPAFNAKIVSINTNNGILNEEYLEKQKRMFMRETMQFFLDELITTKQEYPENDISDVNMITDFFIIKRKDLLKIKEQINIDDE